MDTATKSLPAHISVMWEMAHYLEAATGGLVKKNDAAMGIALALNVLTIAPEWVAALAQLQERERPVPADVRGDIEELIARLPMEGRS
jgi:hypothetical protein